VEFRLSGQFRRFFIGIPYRDWNQNITSAKSRIEVTIFGTAKSLRLNKDAMIWSCAGSVDTRLKPTRLVAILENYRVYRYANDDLGK
jgi:hypothetical protein